MDQFVYPATLTPDPQDGGFVVTFVDVPEAITQGDNVPEALHQAADCLEEAIAGRIRRRDGIPEPSPVRAGQYAVALPAHTAAKAALYVALRQTQFTQVELAARLHCDEKEVRRLLDPRHASKLSRMEAALALLEQQLVIGVQPMSGEEAHGIRGTVASPTRASAKGKSRPQSSRMYEAIGRAVWAAQVFETVIVVCVELVRPMKEFETGTLTDGLINPKRFTNATRHLLKKLSASNDIDPTFEARIAALIDKRHTLMHRWFIEKGWPEDEDVNEIAQVISFAREVEEEAQAITRLLLQYVLHWGTPHGEAPHEPTKARAQILQLFKNAQMFLGRPTA